MSCCFSRGAVVLMCLSRCCDDVVFMLFCCSSRVTSCFILLLWYSCPSVLAFVVLVVVCSLCFLFLCCFLVVLELFCSLCDLWIIQCIHLVWTRCVSSLRRKVYYCYKLNNLHSTAEDFNCTFSSFDSLSLCHTHTLGGKTCCSIRHFFVGPPPPHNKKMTYAAARGGGGGGGVQSQGNGEMRTKNEA